MLSSELITVRFLTEVRLARKIFLNRAAGGSARFYAVMIHAFALYLYTMSEYRRLAVYDLRGNTVFVLPTC